MKKNTPTHRPARNPEPPTRIAAIDPARLGTVLGGVTGDFSVVGADRDAPRRT
jgi:hypothetical protein